MNEVKRRKHLQTMGIQAWELRANAAAPGAGQRQVKLTEITTPIVAAEEPTAEITWQTLEEQVANCQRCELYKTRTQAVFGVGNRQADLLIIGEAPGANEDLQGEPFVGRAGKLLDAMLAAIKLNREEIYIANILKSRPPNNRDPKPEEVAACTPYLLHQIALIKPKLILSVGRIAAQFLLKTQESMGKLRGQEYSYGPYNTPLLVTYHPAYLLRSPREKRKAWEDLQLVAQRLKQLQQQ